MSLWRGESLVLASKSPARQALLAAAKIPFEAQAADIDERAVEAGSGATAPEKVAAHLARAKALYVAKQRAGRLVLGADQTLALGERRFSKPAGPAQAADQLRALAGRTHALHSAIAVARDGEILFDHVASVQMTMRPLSEAFVVAYLDEAGAAVTTSVGAYQLEGAGIHLFERIVGDHSTILGLPLLPLLDFLRRQGALLA